MVADSLTIRYRNNLFPVNILTHNLKQNRTLKVRLPFYFCWHRYESCKAADAKIPH
ncbi:hypothetical protein SAMN05444266_11012 [Chitinophaga jiangningensis]|uniref:Uncharacterized protein n=1 Tax=Chitinophaga jiangningensis TaxID=1419482 RepID=A0A1M7KV71_9BACT|nr:hypothetical protein SAMN05444266_11012 [Chitinophaga jiangningensis]